MHQRIQRRQRQIAIGWLLLISINALAAGYSFMAEPTGKGLGIPLSYLQYSPFDTYLVPGIVLFTAIGVLSLLVAILGIIKHNFFPYGLCLQGCVLLGWIGIQMWMVDVVNLLHVLCGISGLAWLVIGFLLLKSGSN